LIHHLEAQFLGQRQDALPATCSGESPAVSPLLAATPVTGVTGTGASGWVGCCEQPTIAMAVNILNARM